MGVPTGTIDGPSPGDPTGASTPPPDPPAGLPLPPAPPLPPPAPPAADVPPAPVRCCRRWRIRCRRRCRSSHRCRPPVPILPSRPSRRGGGRGLAAVAGRAAEDRGRHTGRDDEGAARSPRTASRRPRGGQRRRSSRRCESADHSGTHRAGVECCRSERPAPQPRSQGTRSLQAGNRFLLLVILERQPHRRARGIDLVEVCERSIGRHPQLRATSDACSAGARRSPGRTGT